MPQIDLSQTFRLDEQGNPVDTSQAAANDAAVQGPQLPGTVDLSGARTDASGNVITDPLGGFGGGGAYNPSLDPSVDRVTAAFSGGDSGLAQPTGGTPGAGTGSTPAASSQTQGGAPAGTAAAAGTQARKFTSPMDAFNSQFANTTGKTPLTQRDLAAEQQAIGQFGKAFGRLPSRDSDWQLIRNALYGGKRFDAVQGDGQAGGEKTGDTAIDEVTDALGGEDGGSETTTDDGTEETGSQFENVNIKTIMESFGIDKIDVPDFSGEQERLDNLRDARIASIENNFETQFQEQQQENNRAMAAYKANLVKLGVPLDSTSYTSAVTGQDRRNDQAMARLEREKARQIAEAEANYLTNTRDLSKDIRETTLQANVANTNNLLQGLGLAKDVWQVFLEREDAEKRRELEAHQSLLKYQTDIMGMEQDERLARLGMIENFASDGLYNTDDPDVVQLLEDIEGQTGLNPGELVNAAHGGLIDRLSNMALKTAQTESNLASAERARAETSRLQTLLPFEVQQKQADIANKLSSAAEKNKEGGGQSVNAALTGIEEYLSETAMGDDGRIDTAKYKQAKNTFIEQLDPEFKNEKFLEQTFYEYLPPDLLLNQEDPTAKPILDAVAKNEDSWEDTLAKAIASSSSNTE